MVEQSGDASAPVTDSTESPVVSPQEPYRPIGLADEFKGSEGRDLETRIYVEGRVPWPPASDG